RFEHGIGFPPYTNLAALHGTLKLLREKYGVDRSNPREAIESVMHPDVLEDLAQQDKRWWDHLRWLERREERVAVVADSLRWDAVGGAFGSRDCDVRQTHNLKDPPEAYPGGEPCAPVYFPKTPSPLGTVMTVLVVKLRGSIVARQT